MKTPEQIAQEALTRSTRYPADILGHIIHAIEADRAQRSYVAAIEYNRTGQRRDIAVTLTKGETIVEAIQREGDAAEEWNLIDVAAIA